MANLDLEQIITAPGAADSAPAGAEKINNNFTKVEAAIPVNTSDLTNDSGFITNAVSNLANYYTKTQTYTKEEVNSLVGQLVQIQVVSSLPQSGQANTIYLVPSGGSKPDVYDEYIWVNSAWELIGNTEVDLSNYLQKTGDASDTTVAFVSEAGDPTSGSKLSSLIGRIVKKISDIVSGTIAVAKATSATKATQDSDGNKISETYLKRSGGTMTGNLALSNEVRVNGAVGNLIGRFTWAGGLKAVVGNSQDTLALLSNGDATLNGSPIITGNGGVISGNLVHKKGNCSIHTDVASYRIPSQHKGWIALDCGLGYNIALVGYITLYGYYAGALSIQVSGYTYAEGIALTRDNWVTPRYGIHGSWYGDMPQVAFVKDGTTGRRYIIIGGDDFAWNAYDYVSLDKVVLGSLGNKTEALPFTWSALSGTTSLGLVAATAGDMSQGVEVQRARQDGNGKDIPSTYATKEEVSSLSIGGVNYITGLKEGWEAGYVNEKTGIVIANANNIVTKDYQDISPLAGKRATISASDEIIDVNGQNQYYYLRYVFYDSNKTFISGGGKGSNVPPKATVEVPSTAAYVKVSIGVGIANYALNNFERVRFKMELGDYATDYMLAPQDIPTVNDLPDVYVDTVPSNPKDGDILITTTD